MDATDSVSVQLWDDRHYCHWHSENRLTSPEWWLAEYYRGFPERRPTNAQIDELEALLATIELGLNTAHIAVDVELTPAMKEKIRRYAKIRRDELMSLNSKSDQEHGPEAIPSREKRERPLFLSLSYRYSAEIRGLPHDRWAAVALKMGLPDYTLGRVVLRGGDRLVASSPSRDGTEIRELSDNTIGAAEILVGEWPALDAALDAKATLHHDAPKRIRQLIESFK